VLRWSESIWKKKRKVECTRWKKKELKAAFLFLWLLCCECFVTRRWSVLCLRFESFVLGFTLFWGLKMCDFGQRFCKYLLWLWKRVLLCFLLWSLKNRLRPIFYLYLSVSNSVYIATDLGTETFQNLTVKIMVSNSVSKDTEILATNYWSLIRSL
jgi:hypothetical protein